MTLSTDKHRPRLGCIMRRVHRVDLGVLWDIRPPPAPPKPKRINMALTCGCGTRVATLPGWKQNHICYVRVCFCYVRRMSKSKRTIWYTLGMARHMFYSRPLASLGAYSCLARTDARTRGCNPSVWSCIRTRFSTAPTRSRIPIDSRRSPDCVRLTVPFRPCRFDCNSQRGVSVSRQTASMWPCVSASIYIACRGLDLKSPFRLTSVIAPLRAPRWCYALFGRDRRIARVA